MSFRIRIGTVTGRALETNRDSLNEFIMLQVRFFKDDVQTVQFYSQAGDDTSPPNGTKVIVLELGTAFKVAIASDDVITSSMQPGEKKLYSTVGQDIKAFINLLNSGIIELNGNNDFIVRFNALNTALQTFVVDVNAALATKLNGAGSPGVLTLDIGAAKVDEVKVI